MAVTVADLVKYYADAPPPKSDSLAGLEARRTPGYQSPFKFEPSSLQSLGVGSFGTTKYGPLGEYTSVADALKLPTAPNVTSLYPLHRAAGLGTPGVPSLSELFAQRIGTSSRPLWEQIAERRGPAAGPVGLGKFLYDGGEALGRIMEAWRPQFEKFGLFMQNAAPGLQNLQRTLEALRLRPPFLYDALDAWEAFLEGDIEALDRFIVDHLGRRPDDRTRLAVQNRLERAFGTEDAPIPEWAGEPSGFDVGVFRLIRRQVRAEEAAIIDEVQRLREAGVDRVKVGFESGWRLRKALAQELGLDNKALWIDKELEDHYVRERFPGAVLVARDEKPNLPEMPSRKREPNLRSHTATVVAREAGEGLIKQKVIARPLETNEYNELVVPFDPKEDHGSSPGVLIPVIEGTHMDRFEAQERERGRMNQLHEAMRRAGLSQQEEEVMRLKWVEGLGNKEVATRLGRSASHVGVQAWRGFAKVKDAARG